MSGILSRQPIPGTYADGFTEPELRPIPAPRGPQAIRGTLAWQLGEVRVWRFRDDDGLHLALEHDRRYPSWDEIKVARYRLLPDETTFALILPPRLAYVDRPDRPHIFELTEVRVHGR